MKKIVIGLVFIIALAACTNHGKKINIEGTKSEVFYKGDGVTEEDAKKTGKYLTDIGFVNADRAGSIQISREGDTYLMRFVYDKNVYDTFKNIVENFKLIAADASKEIFNGKKVDIALADKHFKDYKTIPFDESFVKKEDDIPPPPDQTDLTSKDDFKNKTEAGINFFWFGIADEEAKMISDYIVRNGSFSGGKVQLYMTKENDRYIIRFPINETARADESYLQALGAVTQQIKDNVFANVPYSFYATDENMVTVKAWDY